MICGINPRGKLRVNSIFTDIYGGFLIMKIKSILAGIAAVCTIGAVSATAFADDAPILISPAPAADEDIMVIMPSPEALKAAYVEKFSEGFYAVKSEIAKAGGVDAYFEKARAAMKALTVDEIKTSMKEVFTAQGVSEEKIAAALELLDAASDADLVFSDEGFNEAKPFYEELDKYETPDEYFEYVIHTLSTDDASKVLFLLKNSEVVSDVVVPDAGDNVDSGVESVAVVVGVIAVAGAVVVVSRKKA